MVTSIIIWFGLTSDLIGRGDGDEETGGAQWKVTKRGIFDRNWLRLILCAGGEESERRGAEVTSRTSIVKKRWGRPGTKRSTSLNWSIDQDYTIISNTGREKKTGRGRTS